VMKSERRCAWIWWVSSEEVAINDDGDEQLLNGFDDYGSECPPQPTTQVLASFGFFPVES
jgi:hypothetical protein